VDIVALATRYGRYGYRRITALLRSSGWLVNPKRVERIWRREGLKVPAWQPRRGRLWLTDGSCIRLQPEHPNHVWSDDFVEDRTHDGGRFRMLNVIDEFTRECLAIRVGRRLRSADVIDVLSDLFILRGCARTHPLRQRTGVHRPGGAGPDRRGRCSDRLHRAGQPVGNGFCESFNAKLRDELLDGEIFYSLDEARVIIEGWRRHYNAGRPHPKPSCRAPARLRNPGQLRRARSPWRTHRP